MASKSSSVQLGIIGLGVRGEWLAELAHRPQEHLHVCAGADAHAPALVKFRNKFGDEASAFGDYRQMLALPQLDAVIIASPDFLHEEHAVAALEAGKAVYVEKPMAITTAGCDRILRAARDAGRAVYVGHNMRYMPVMLKIKQLIDAGAIGEVKAGWCRHFISYGGEAYFKDWHADRKKSTSLLLQKGAHDIDMLHWFCGGYTRQVSAMGGLTLFGQIGDRIGPGERGVSHWGSAEWPPLRHTKLNHIVDVEDLSMVLMGLDNGVYASYQQCHYAPDGWRNYTIIGTEGRVENFGDAPGQSVVRVWKRRTRFNPYGDEQHFVARDEAEGGHGGADELIMADFVRVLREGGEPGVSAVAARQSVATGCAATESLRRGGVPCMVPPISLSAPATEMRGGGATGTR